MEMERTTVLRLSNIHKSFLNVRALVDVSFDLLAGEVHVLCGENGAGKSTLMKILAGNYPQDRGDIYLDGDIVRIKSQLAAEQIGISIVYQELSLSPTVNVAENIFMGREPDVAGVIHRKTLMQEAKRYLDIVGAKVDPRDKTSLLSTAQMQLVQIAKALSTNARIIIMDEPCSSLSEDDTENLFKIIRELCAKGISIIYIDHRLENVFQIGDRVTVLRDGHNVGTRDVKGITRDELVRMMVGREISDLYPKETTPSNEVFFSASGLSNAKLKDISFDVKRGEVFGLAGLVGAGRSEIIRAIFGVDKIHSGKIEMMGRPVKIGSPRDAIRNGMGYVPEDRKLEGLVLYRDIVLNAMMVRIRTLTRGLFTNARLAARETEEQVRRLDIKTDTIYTRVAELSGGNQQKVVLAKWLAVGHIGLFLLDEPTRGIDVGAKHEVYKLINVLAGAGMSIILVTSELPELLGLCDRIAVISDGRIKDVVERSEFSQERIISLCV